ncbi:putative FERM domain-containing protein 4A isoform X2 [Apostichopus japonicus]|uniref:Putative FERM domain-containing protein 4A isoform X2 n=1 Tax=Stichopus japonicus TaxID=307972 RepID=A0A2G8KBD2_STIJA|nr:putative FERM domain-containing protein 4A isoform X2 [Apostichopus japonicus]
MSEGKRAQVILLDKKKVELTIGPKLSGRDLLDLVVSYCSLKEKEYFGLAFLDDTNHYNWLQRDKNVLDHELPRPPQGEPLTLYFRVQYFSESIAKLRDSITIELFYLQAKESVFKGEIEVDSETAFELAAYVLQAVDGDYRSDKQARDTLKKLPVLPQSTLKEHPSLLFCEERILYYYKQNQRFTTGQSIVCPILFQFEADYGDDDNSLSVHELKVD